MNDFPFSKKRYRKQYDKLVKAGFLLLRDISVILEPDFPYKKIPGRLFIRDYQRWYFESLSFLKQVLPFRADEFESLYQGKTFISPGKTYSIKEWLLEKREFNDRVTRPVRLDHAEAAINMFNMQCEILRSSDFAVNRIPENR